MEHSYHLPVLMQPVLDALQVKPDGVYVDGTAGGGGHSFAIASRLTTGRLIALDQDPDAIREASRRLAGLPAEVVQSNFADMDRVLAERGIAGVDGILLDIGVSSHQLDGNSPKHLLYTGAGRNASTNAPIRRPDRDRHAPAAWRTRAASAEWCGLPAGAPTFAAALFGGRAPSRHAE